ncbi:MAG TPA: glycosyltransferase family 1 protein [Pseudonocardiaceae bacterium]|nr:glycosyltransferase family 1 protein [Pseudonocardiaceae bacterium]
MPQLLVLAEQLLAPVPGGTGRYTRELTTALAAAAPAGWTVTTAVARHADPSAALLPGVDGPTVLPLPPRALTAAWEHGLPFWPGGDAVHAPTPLAPPAAKHGHSLVVTVHDTVPWTHPETLTRRGAAWHRKVITRAVRRASAIVVPTSAVVAELSQHAPPDARVHVIGHGTPKALATPADEQKAREIRFRLHLPERYVLAVGTVEPRKGLTVLVEAMSRPTAPDLPLVVAGPTGWGGVDLASVAQARGLPPSKLVQLGELTDEELGVVLRAASVLAVPSLAEGFGLPLLEAMSVGVPVVHSDAPALIEVAAGTGLMARRNDPAALANALRLVFADETRTQARAEAAKLRAARFTWAHAAEQMWHLHLELYQAAKIGLG